MKKIILNVCVLLALVMLGPLLAADNAVILTPGSGVTMRSTDVGGGLQAMRPIVYQLVTPSANFTRPADTTAYAVGDLIANSTTAGSVTPLSWTVNDFSAEGVSIRRVRINKSTTGATAPNFRLHLYTTSPTVANGDNGAFSSTSVGYFCTMDVNMPTTDPFSDGGWGFGVPNNGVACDVVPAASTVYGLVEARGAYAPGNAEVFTVLLEVTKP